MQSDTKTRIDQLTSPAGHSVTIIRFEGDIEPAEEVDLLGLIKTDRITTDRR